MKFKSASGWIVGLVTFAGCVACSTVAHYASQWENSYLLAFVYSALLGLAMIIISGDMNTPQLNDGEVYAGALIKPDGTGHHIILLPGDNDDPDWQSQMDWAKSIGGDLPSCPELAHLYVHLKQEFKPAWYWSNEQHESYSVYAWIQDFYNGKQYWDYKSGKLRARAVRRVAIGE